MALQKPGMMSYIPLLPACQSSSNFEEINEQPYTLGVRSHRVLTPNLVSKKREVLLLQFADFTHNSTMPTVLSISPGLAGQGGSYD